MSNKLTAEVFIRNWQKSKSVRDFCTRTGMNTGTACTRANYYRKKGVPLKKFHRSDSLDFEQLKNLAKNSLVMNHI